MCPPQSLVADIQRALGAALVVSVVVGMLTGNSAIGHDHHGRLMLDLSYSINLPQQVLDLAAFFAEIVNINAYVFNQAFLTCEARLDGWQVCVETSSPRTIKEHLLNHSAPTIDGLVRNAANADPAKAAIIDGDRTFTYAELDAAIDSLSAAFHAGDIGPGCPVALLMLNQWEFVVTYHAALRAGATVVPLNWRLSAVEIQYQLSDSAARVLVADESFIPLLAQATQSTQVDWTLITGESRVPGTDLVTDLMDRYSGQAPPHAGCSMDSPSGIWYTSGTTGHPKGATVTHGSGLWAGVNVVIASRMQPESRVLAVSPMFHRGPTEGLHVAGWTVGATQVMMRRFDPAALLRAIEEHGITHAFVVPTMSAAVLKHPECNAFDLRSMECWMSAASAMPVGLPSALEKSTTLRRGVVFDAYGVTEALLVTMQKPEDLREKQGSVGRPAPSNRVRVVCSDGSEGSTGEVGEITVATPTMAYGYLNQDEAWSATTEVLDGITWYRTGDLGYRDVDGFVYLVDRSKDMVISGGENVYSVEVESALQFVEGVAEAAVVGVPDEQWGEIVTAVVVPKRGSDLSVEQIRLQLAGRLADYKQPRRLEIVDELPRNSFGKLRKNVIRNNLERS